MQTLVGLPHPVDGIPVRLPLQTNSDAGRFSHDLPPEKDDCFILSRSIIFQEVVMDSLDLLCKFDTPFRKCYSVFKVQG
jgi:hypothetical protein